MVITVTVVGPFEEEEEGTGIVSDVVKVQGEDPVTPGLLPKGIDPGTVTIPQYRVNKNKATHHTRLNPSHPERKRDQVLLPPLKRGGQRDARQHNKMDPNYTNSRLTYTH